jgi:hypothetical protein
MFKRCFITIGLIITVISVAILLTFAIHTNASNHLNLLYIETPTEVTARLIRVTIDSFNPNLSADQKTVICQTIIMEANLTEFDPLFISAVIAAESSFVPKAVSPCAAQGLMQLTSCVIQIMHINNPFDIQENIFAGTRYLKDLRRKFRDTELTLAAYNAGPTRVARLGKIPRISETINYIKKVQRFYMTMQEQFRITLLNSMIQPVCFRSEEPSSNHFLRINLQCQIETLPGPVSKSIIVGLEIDFNWRRERLMAVFYPYSKRNLQCC